MNELNIKDILMHTIASIVITLVAVLWPPWGLILPIALIWVLREAAQSDSGNFFSAMKNFPYWSLQKQFEWYCPTIWGIFVILISQLII